MALLWMLLRGNLTFPAFLEGVFFAVLTILVTRGVLGASIRRPLPHLLRRLPWIVALLVVVAKNLVVGSVDVAYRSLHPRLPVYPGILAVDVRGMGDLELTSLANVITLTPGTMTIEVDTERGLLFVHTINARDLGKTRADIRRIGALVERAVG
jgi:multicomponent Na+:H+ antiporter subunit E